MIDSELIGACKKANTEVTQRLEEAEIILASPHAVEASGDTAADMVKVANLAYLVYQCGRYADSLHLVSEALVKLQPPPNPNPTTSTNTNTGNNAGGDTLVVAQDVVAAKSKLLWGKLASLIMLIPLDDDTSSAVDSSTAFTEHYSKQLADTIVQLKECIEQDSSLNALQKLKQRTWLCHWSVFLLLVNSADCRGSVYDLFWTPQYLNAIQTTAPYLIRYLVTVTLMYQGPATPRTNDLVRVLNMDKKLYSDALSEFALCILHICDFEMAAGKLYAECRDTVIPSDPFLRSCQKECLARLAGKLLVNYRKIYSNPSVDEMAKRLGVSNAAESIANVGVKEQTPLSVRSANSLRDLKARTTTMCTKVF